MRKIRLVMVTFLVVMIGMPPYHVAQAETEVDAIPPKIKSVVADKEYVAPGEKISFSMDVEDDSAIGMTFISIVPVKRNINSITVSLKLNPLTGKFEGTYKVPDTAFNERWKIYSVYSQDIHGNKVYSQVGSANWGFKTEFVIFDGNDSVKPDFQGMYDEVINVNSDFDALKNVKAFDEIDGDLTSQIKVNGIVDTTKLGKYPIQYAVTDKAGNTMEVQRTIEVLDIEKPVLNGVKDFRVYIEEDQPNLLKGITAYDNWDKDITSKIVITGSYDLKKKGTYPIQYSVSDSSGNVTTQKANVSVLYYGITPMTDGMEDKKLLVNETFDPMANIKAYDSAGNDFTSQVQLVGKVDTSKAGRYPLEYRFKDGIYREISKERIVSVYEKREPIFVGVDDITIVEDTDFTSMQGVSAIDSFEENVDNISSYYHGSLNEVGVHEIFYTAIDRWGQKIEHTRTVKVIAKEVNQLFTDVPKTHIYYKEIAAMKNAGIINGYPDGSFKPGANIKRQHVAALIYRANVDLTPKRPAISFKDVPVGHTYYKEIQALYQAGIIDGTDGFFKPNDELTRAQLAKILVNAFQLKQGTGEQIPFYDISNTAWEKEYVDILSSNNITTGDNGYFKPRNKVTRMHYAVFMYRALQIQ